MADIRVGRFVTAKVVLNRAEAEAWSQKFIKRKATEISDRMVDIARQEAPVKTGKLRANIRPAPFRMTGPYKGEGGIEVDTKAVPYAGYVMYGTRPHRIVARNAPALRFFWPKVGRVVFFKSVNHPGTKANRFMERALNRAAREIR